MASGDLEVLFTADDKAVSTSMDKLARQAGGFSKRMAEASGNIQKQLLGFSNIGPAAAGAFGVAFGLASKATLDYASKNDLVLGSLERLKSASRETWTAIGRDIAGGGVDTATEFVRTIERARQETVDFVALLLSGGTSKLASDAVKENEKAIAVEKARLSVLEQTRGVQAQIASIRGDDLVAVRLQAEIEREAALKKANELTDGPEKSKLVELINLAAVEKVAKAQREFEEEQRKAHDQSLKEASAESKRNDENIKRINEELDASELKRKIAAENLEIQMAEADLDLLRLTGTKQLVALEEERLKTRKEILDIQRTEGLNEAQKSAAIARIEGVSTAKLASLSNAPQKTEDQRARLVGSGLNATGLTVAAGLGVGGVVASQTRDFTKRTAEAVEKIAKGGSVAVFGR